MSGANLQTRITRISNSKRQFRSSLLAVDWTFITNCGMALVLGRKETEISLGVAVCRNYVVIQAQPHG
jgi:hypothetical protein